MCSLRSAISSVPSRASSRSVCVPSRSRPACAYTTLLNLANGKSRGIEFGTLNALMKVFGTRSINDLLEYLPDEPRDEAPRDEARPGR